MDERPPSFGQYPPARRVLAHLSDTHLLGGAALLGGLYDVSAGLDRALAALEDMRIRLDALVFTGDLTDLGEPDAYRALRAAVEPVARNAGAELVWVAGNHDERPAMRAALHDLPATDDPLTGSWDLGGLRLIALDTTVPGWHHGELDAAQLEWLQEQLREPAELGTVLAMHHPPVPSHVPLFDILELRDQARFAEVISGTDVRGILAGHLHYSTAATFAGVPVSVAAATCYTMDLARPPVAVNGMDAGQSVQIVHVYDDVVTHSVVPLARADVAGTFSAAWYAEMASLTPEERLDRFSRKRPAS